MKIFSLRKQYFFDSWNIFDFFMIVLTLVGVILNYTLNINVGQSAIAFRTVRILRVLKLIKNAESLRIFVSTLFHTLTSLAGISALLLLTLFIFASILLILNI